MALCSRTFPPWMMAIRGASRTRRPRSGTLFKAEKKRRSTTWSSSGPSGSPPMAGPWPRRASAGKHRTPARSSSSGTSPAEGNWLFSQPIPSKKGIYSCVRSRSPPDGQTLASGTNFKSRVGSLIDAPAEVTLWDMAAGRVRSTIRTKQYDDVSSLRFDASARALGVEYGGRTMFGPIDVNELYDLAVEPPR